MACRDALRAQTARRQLYALLDQHVSTLRPGSQEHGYATTFRSNVKLELETLDLASMKSVLEFGRTVAQKCVSLTRFPAKRLTMLRRRYEYISHLILNAGTATYSHLDTRVQLYDMFVRPFFASTHPRSNIQKNGVLSADNLGYVWQCNVFGHYCVVRLMFYWCVCRPLISTTTASVSLTPASPRCLRATHRRVCSCDMDVVVGRGAVFRFRG